MNAKSKISVFVAAAALLLVAAIFCAPPALAVEQLLPFGYSYFTPPEEVGTEVVVVGFMDPPVGFEYPITVDFVNFEYTFVLHLTISNILPGLGSTTTLFDADFGRIWMQQDGAKNADFGVNPPNATVPSTFEDGNTVLEGHVYNAVRIDLFGGVPGPSMVANVDWDEGGRHDQLKTPSGWTLHVGLSEESISGIPEGYQRNWACKIVPPAIIPVEESTWGAIKATYR